MEENQEYIKVLQQENENLRDQLNVSEVDRKHVVEYQTKP